MAVATSTAILGGAAIAGPIIGGVIGNMASAGARAKAEAAAREAMAIIDAVGAPPDLSQEIILEKFRQVGVLTPELEGEINLGFSKVAQIKEDPKLREAQFDALTKFKELGKSGLRPEDRAALADIQNQVQGDLEAKRQQVIQNLQARGQAGSGAELAASIANSQAAAQRGAEEGRGVAALASQRALQALQTQAGLAGDIRGQDFDVEKTKASAEDVVSQFNAANAISRQNRNIERNMGAQQYNLGTAQRISEQNVSQSNNEKYRQAEAKRQYWQDQLALASAKAGARTGQVPMYQQQADRTAQMWQGIGSGVGAGAGMIGGYMQNQAMMDKLYPQSPAPTSQPQQLPATAFSTSNTYMKS